VTPALSKTDAQVGELMIEDKCRRAARGDTIQVAPQLAYAGPGTGTDRALALLGHL
jgi:hypothetical protein